jgi:hypothetical protein
LLLEGGGEGRALLLAGVGFDVDGIDNAGDVGGGGITGGDDLDLPNFLPVLGILRLPLVSRVGWAVL